MNVREIVINWLQEHGYDGLYCEDCGCGVDDLAPCAELPMFDCNAGYRWSREQVLAKYGFDGCTFAILAGKPAADVKAAE